MFTETVRAANHAINRLDPLVAVELITGSTARGQRREILDDLRVRTLDAVAAPRVLDEGIDVPDANLGVVMSASRTRRQMIQRMGRILRRKRSGVAARFVIMFAQDTLEDPSNRFERDGFLDEIERISEGTGVFDSTKFEALDPFLAAPGPSVVPEPEYVEHEGGAIDPSVGVEVAYALAGVHEPSPPGLRADHRARATGAATTEADRRCTAVSRALALEPPARRHSQGCAQAAVDGRVGARDRPGRRRVAHQLHRMRRGITPRAVPLAGAGPDRGLPLRLTSAIRRGCVRMRVAADGARDRDHRPSVERAGRARSLVWQPSPRPRLRIVCGSDAFLGRPVRQTFLSRSPASASLEILDAAAFFDGRLPEAFGGYPRNATKYPVQYPTACSPQAWSTGTPLLLLRTMLGLEPTGIISSSTATARRHR